MEMQSIDRQTATQLPAMQIPCETSVFFVPDKTADAREAWFTRLNPRSRPIRLKAGMTSLPHIPKRAAVVILHGEDPLQLLALIQESNDLLSGRIRIALCTKSLPQERALLLHAGFDDVFDLDMAQEEALARIEAMNRRRSLQQGQPTIDDRLRARIRSYVLTRLTPREYRLMALLVSRPGKSVPVDDLARYTGGAGQPTKSTVLQVMICRLRKKLKPGHAIVSTNQDGYLLTTP